MKYPWIDEYLMAMPHVTRDYKAEWGWDRYMLDGKMFAAVCHDPDGKVCLITLKLDPMEGELMRRTYPDVIPGYYMNKVHWNSVKADGNVPDDALRTMLDHAWSCMLKSFSLKKQRELSES